MSESSTPTSELPPLTTNGKVPRFTPIGTVVDHWDCPSCDRSIDIVHRPGRPRLYCSQACRQRAYRWRRRNRAHTTSTPAWPAEVSGVNIDQRRHAMRTDRDPMSRRRDRRGREVTVCGVLSRTHERARRRGYRVPFTGVRPDDCCTCASLTRPRPLGLVPPGDAAGTGTFVDDARALRSISDTYPLDPLIRHLAATAWAA